MQTIGDILVSVTVGGQTSRTWVVRGCDGRRTDGWDVSQQFLRRSKDRRLGLEPNSFSDGQWTDTGDSSWLGFKTNSFSVGWRTDAWDSSRIWLEPNSFAVGRQTDVWDFSQLGLESIYLSWLGLEPINSFGHILCKEILCLTVLGTQELTLSFFSCTFGRELKALLLWIINCFLLSGQESYYHFIWYGVLQYLIKRGNKRDTPYVRNLNS